MMSRSRFLLWVMLSVALMIALMTLSERFFWTVDLSEDSRFTLPEEISGPLQNLKDPLVIKAYLPLSAPPPYRYAARHTRDLLLALERVNSEISLDVIDSAEERSESALSSLVEEAQQQDVSTSQLSVERSGRRLLLEVPYGVSFARLNQRFVTPPVERFEEVVYHIARATHHMMELRPPQRLGLSQGSGEPDLMNSPLASRLASEGELIPVRLDGESIEDEVDVLVLLGATKLYGERARWVIDRLLCDGGSVVIALDHRQQSELFTDVWSPRPTGLEPLLKRYGVTVHTQWVIADVDHPAPAPLTRDARGHITFAPHPLYPLAKTSSHPISATFEEVVVPMSPLYEVPPEADVLARSLPSSVALRALKSLNIAEAEAERSDALGFPLGFALEFRVEECLPRPITAQPPLNERPVESSNDHSRSARGDGPLARLVVLGSGRRLLGADSKGLELLMNAIAWGRRDESLLKLKRRRVERAKLTLSLAEQRMIQWGTATVPFLMIMLISAIVSRPRRPKRSV